MKNIIIVLEATLGGTRKYCADVLRLIDTRRFHVTYVYSTVRADKNFFEDLAWMKERGIEMYEIPMSREIGLGSDLRSFLALFRFLRTKQYDLIHAHSSKAGFLARMASVFARPSATIVYQPHMMAYHIRTWYTYIERFAALFTDMIITDSESERRSVIMNRITHPAKVRTVNAGIEIPVEEGQTGLGRGQESSPAASNPTLVGAVARLTYPKDPFTFIKAASILKARGLPVQFCWVGDGDLLEECRHIVAQQGLDQVVRFLGWQPDAQAWMKKFGLLVHCSDYESFGYVLAEAMALRRPVVASDVTGVSDLVEVGKTGYLYPRGDAEKLAELIQHLVEHPALAREMGIAGRLRVESKFSVAGMVRETENLYDQLLSTSSVPTSRHAAGVRR